MYTVIGFDADDTLWDNEIIYHQMKVRFGEILSKHDEPKKVKERLDDIEVVNLEFYGYGIKSFALSMIETAIDLADGKVNSEDLQALLAIVKEMMTTDVQLVDKVEDVLRKLSGDDIRGERSPDWLSYFMDGAPNPKWLRKMESIREILTSNGRTLAQGALAWLWARSEKTLPIPGFRTVAQVEENCGAIQFGPLTEKQMQEINSLLGR